MSLVRVAVPVLHGRCKFFFEKGRPWTVIEHVLLESLTKKSHTIVDLAEAGKLPQRLAIEAVIRLMRAGWVEMVEKGSRITFRATDNGLVAATRDELPNVPRQMNRNMSFVVDQVTGTVYRSRELPFLHEHMVKEMAKKEKIVWIERPEIEQLGEVGQLLDVLFAHDEKFVSMDVDGGRLAKRWSLVSVRDGKPSDLTSRAPKKLVECIESAASGTAVEEGLDTRSVYQLADVQEGAELHTLPVRRINLVSRDVVLGGGEHEEVLRSTLSRSRRRVVIHSTFISLDRFNTLLPALRDAVQRGVQVDVLWGQDEVLGDNATREVVNSIRGTVASEHLDSLHVHPFSTGSHSKILLADEGESDRITAFVGSCNWLSSPFQSFEATVRLRDPSIVADVVNQVAELSKGGRGRWTPLTKELAAMSAELRAVGSPGSRRQTRAQVILGNAHANMVRRARDESIRRIFVASHRWGAAARPIVLAPALAAAESKGVRVQAYYGTVSGPEGPDRVGEERPGKTGALTIRAVKKPRLHAKMLAWDEDSVVITSQNWLSADPPDSAPRQEIGVFLEGPGLADSVVDRFQAALKVGRDELVHAAVDDAS